MEKQFKNIKIEIDTPHPEDALGAQMVFYHTWLDTYPNKKLNISTDDIKNRFTDRLTDDGIAKMAEQILHPKPNTLFLVARNGKDIIGVCRLKKDEKNNELGAIYVLPEYQGMKVGFSLWLEAQKFFDYGKDIIVKVADYNEKAIGFYKKLGFIDTGKRFFDEKHKMKSGAVIPEMEMIIKSKY